MLNLTAFTQIGTDTTKIKCFPTSVVKKIAKDLLKGDSAIAELNVANNQISELNHKIILKDSVISKFEEKEKNFTILTNSQDEKYKLLEKSNKDLQDKLIKEKFKLRRNTWISIAGAIITSLSVTLIR